MTESTPAPSTRPAAPPPENLLLNLVFNVIAPTFVLSKLSPETRLGPLNALLVGMAFPLVYGIYDLIRRRKWNVLSMVGLASVGLSGGFGLMKVGPMGFAVKDAAVPACFAIAIMATIRSKRPLVRELVLNESTVDVPRIEAALDQRGTRAEFARLLVTSTWMMVASFGVSSVLNFIFARLIITAEAGTAEFTQQLGKMTWVSHTVLIVPNLLITVVVLWHFFSRLRILTGLDFEALVRAPEPKQSS